jgi:hypothetical protein
LPLGLSVVFKRFQKGLDWNVTPKWLAAGPQDKRPIVPDCYAGDTILGRRPCKHLLPPHDANRIECNEGGIRQPVILCNI